MADSSGKHRVLTSDKTPGVEFVIGAAAAVGAGFFTNPIDVVKIRLQLQGELESRGSYKKIYRNTFHAAYTIARIEGLLALQRGLVTALGFQVVLNGMRLGSYNLARRYELTVNDKGDTNILSTALVSGVAGCAGAVLGSPLYLVKTVLQSKSSKSIAVGTQHEYASGTIDAFRHLWREGGFSGLYRGWYANIPRVFVGSATQLTTFSLFLDWLKPMEIFDQKPILLTFVASLLGGSCVALTMQPFDVVATRLYNQGTNGKGKGVLYDGLFDALNKVFKAEGLTGLYKGISPTFFRIAPHTVLCLVFYEKLARLYANYN
ncbi:solute carrier family 25 member 35 [Copidosoma floridanum]|uniref:solute carrier family 25 member 35 n=1 Tax=Copidosoma floridanum TaxID=29053 RepID=UPI0006C964BF|nr:solute carrier family 25 member 35 [Copidosoma floridanum]